MTSYRAKYSTPFGTRWLTVRAASETNAFHMAQLKTPWRAGWVLEGIEEVKREKPV